MGGPGDGVGFARPGRMLDEILAARAFFQNGGDQLPRNIELVVAWEDELLDLLLGVSLGQT